MRKKREIGGGNEGDRGPEAGRDLHLETGFAVEELGKKDHEPGDHDAAVHKEKEPLHARKRPRPVERELRHHFDGRDEKGRTGPEAGHAEPLEENRAEGDRHHARKGKRPEGDGGGKDDQKDDRGNDALHQHGEGLRVCCIG